MSNNRNPPNIQRLAELQQLIADFSKIERVVNYADTGRVENDSEHSFGLALTSWLLATRIAPELDQAKIMKYALAHDLVELHSGDTYVFDDEAVKTKAAREAAAVKQLGREWADFPDLGDAIAQYESLADAEARFVYAIDKILPALLIYLGEKGNTNQQTYWEKLQISWQMLADEKRAKIQRSPQMAPYADELLSWLKQFNYFYKPPADNA